MKRNRILILFVTILILFALLSSALFIAAEADHNCTDMHCSVCAHILVCQTILQQLVFWTSVPSMLTALCWLLLQKARLYERYPNHGTLITCKVKLSN